MQPGKEARSLRSGCWRLTLLSCVLAMHLIPGPVHASRCLSVWSRCDRALERGGRPAGGEGHEQRDGDRLLTSFRPKDETIRKQCQTVSVSFPRRVTGFMFVRELPLSSPCDHFCRVVGAAAARAQAESVSTATHPPSIRRHLWSRSDRIM
ncbi:unnamed protein product [Pleuronectes platessa]|uniref:Secreted protein n=1 Tax=Pleuronectes platessa TaxID=8262 RepID=A0A9N7U955_PLEPL|nr:unnamed protein product [Pleuronectes platessa]